MSIYGAAWPLCHYQNPRKLTLVNMLIKHTRWRNILFVIMVFIAELCRSLLVTNLPEVYQGTLINNLIMFMA